MATVTVKTEEDLLREVFRNVRMAGDSIMDLMPKVEDEKLKSDLTVQLSVYEAFASRAAKQLAAAGVKPGEENALSRLSAKWGILMNTVKDSSVPHIVQLVMEGTSMGVGEILRWLHECESAGVSDDALQLARDVLAFEEKTVEDMKSYLR